MCIQFYIPFPGNNCTGGIEELQSVIILAIHRHRQAQL